MSRSSLRAVATVVAVGSMYVTSPAAIVESFDYTLNDTTPANWNGGSGWKASSTWVGTGTQTRTIVAGLGSGFTNANIGNLDVAGNALNVAYTNADTTSTNRQIGSALTTASGETIWMGFLATASALDGWYTNSGYEFAAQARLGGAQAPNWNGADTALGATAVNTGVGMGNLKGDSTTKTNAATTDAASSAMTANTQYLFITKATNAGNTSGPWTVTKWVLDAAKYGQLTALSESQLDAHFFAKATNTAGNFDALANEYFVLLGKTQNASTFRNVTYDEIRMGATLSEAVAVVPEPSTLGAIAVVGAGLAGRRRRR